MKNVEDIYPLTPLQSGMLFHSLMAPESGVYVNQVTCTLPADFDSRLFQQAWERLVQRHAVLRTAFLWDGLEEPLQVVRKKVTLAWRELDWSGVAAAERERRFEELRHAERHTPLSLNKAPLMRFALVRPGDPAGEPGFIWTFHHLLLDGWSSPLLLRELVAVYEALRAGREPALPPVRPFGDYIVWLQKQDPARAEPFWRRELAGLTTTSTPGIVRPAPAADAAAAADDPGEHRVQLSREVTAELQALAARHGLTLQTVTQGAWAVLLGRYGNTGDVVFGSVVSGRPATLPGVETMVGMFVNTLPVRVRMDAAEPLLPWLRRLQERQLARQDFEHSPLSQIQRWSEVPAGSPLFEALYAFENYPDASDGGGAGLRIGNPRSFESTNYPLTLTLVAGERIALQLLYDRARVDGEAARRLLGHFAALLANVADIIAANPDRRLGELELLTAAEARELAEWNATAREYPQAAIHELFAEQAGRAPEAVAVAAGGRELTYGELARRSRSLARRLRAAGVGPGSLVGLSAESLPEMTVGMLGILTAGGAYVPLDLSYPPERLAFMLEDTGAAVLVTEAGLAGRLPAPEGVRVELLDGGEEDSAGEPVASFSSPDDPAYVIYTSGSTGRPKGVVVPHRAVVRLVRGTDYVQLGPEDRVAQASNSSFDAATFEIWGALLNGGRLIGLERETVLSPARLTAALRREGVSAMFLTTALFNQVAREVPDGFAPLREVLFGGEAVDPAAVGAVLQAGPPARLLHVYGPTETTTFATWQPVEEVRNGATVPIGKPLANGTLYVLAAGLTRQPAGLPGELYLGGDGVSHGYHARPELTAERFVPDPFAGRPGERLYKTGDLVRQRPDGAVEFLGRLDGQVKIRGFRIEPGEIEAALLALPGVREAAVAVRQDGEPGERRLVAYVAGEDSAEGVRAALRERLPDYMVPAAFTVLDALPLTANGKVDRRALAALRIEPVRKVEEGAAPRTPFEETLASIWEGILGVEKVGLRDDFFELGGHSLLATRVVSRVRETFGVELPLRILFERPTLAALAREVEAASRAGHGLAVPPIRPVPRGVGDPGEAGTPLSFAQEWMWLIDHLDPDGLGLNSPLPVRLRGRLDSGALERALAELVRRHEVLRTTFPVVAGRPVQRVAPAASLALPRIDLAGLPEAARERTARALLDAELTRRLDLERGPLVQARLLVQGPDDHLLVLTVHHILFDGWSAGILVREVATLYAAFSRGEPSSSSALPELPVQYADFAVWQREWLQGETLESMLGYWRERLAGEIPVLELPGARPGAEVTSMRSGRLPIALGPELTAAVHRLARAEGVTLFVALLAAFQALLHRVTRATDIAVGSPIANRNHPEIEGLIGYFVNTLVLRGDLSGDPPFRELVGRLGEVAFGAYAHQDLPFTKLVEALRPDRAASRTPLFQVMFLLQNAPGEPLEAPGTGLTLAPVEWQVQVATFDLTLLLEEAGGQGGGLGGWIWYNRDLLDAGAVAALGERFRLLLESAVADPGRRLSELSLVTEEERRQLLAALRPRFDRHAGREPGANAKTVETALDLLPEQAALLDLLAAEGGIDERDVWAHPASAPAGSPTLAELGARLSGGSLVTPEGPAVTPEAIADLVKGERVTVLTLSPALFEDLAAWSAAAPGRDAGLRSLRWVVVDGEPAAAAVRAWRERFGERRARVVEAPRPVPWL